MILVENKSARHHFEILKTFTAGLVLHGWEVKSIRGRNASLKSAWVRINGEENALFLQQFSVGFYPFSSGIMERERPKKLLLQKSEIAKIARALGEKSTTAVPLKIFTSGKYLKCEIAIARGRKKFEKRQVLKTRDLDRQMRKNFKNT